MVTFCVVSFSFCFCLSLSMLTCTVQRCRDYAVPTFTVLWYLNNWWRCCVGSSGFFTLHHNMIAKKKNRFSTEYCCVCCTIVVFRLLFCIFSPLFSCLWVRTIDKMILIFIIIDTLWTSSFFGVTNERCL
jgi:hypothetical protein